MNALCPEDPPGSNNCGDRKGLAQPTWQEWTGALSIRAVVSIRSDCCVLAAGKYGNDKGSTLEPLPTDDQLLAWAREKLSM